MMATKEGEYTILYRTRRQEIPRWLSGIESVCQAGSQTPWRREWKPTPEFVPGESHGLRSLVGYSTWDCKELDMTEHIYIYTHIYTDTQRHMGLPW